MRLVEVRNGELVPGDELFLIRPIRELWNSDHSIGKENFFDALGIIYYMCDPRSSYSYITDLDERLRVVLVELGLGEGYKISEELSSGMRLYAEHVKTTSVVLLENARMACTKISNFLRDVDFTKKDKSGKPLYTINSVTSALKQIPQIAKDLQETEKIVNQELLELDSRARGGNERKKIFEDGVK